MEIPVIIYIFRITFGYFFEILEFILIVYILLSWIPLKQNNKIVQIINTVTEPMLLPIRKLLDHSILGGRNFMVDLSPIIAFIVLGFLQKQLLG